MRNNFEVSMPLVLKHEGGWANHPSDPGGMTMKGVTKRTYEAYLGKRVSAAELRNIPDSHLYDIYKTRYWDVNKCDELPYGVDYAVFDASVNSGPSRGAKWLQRAVGVEADGKVGPITLDAVQRADPDVVIKRMTEDRLNWLKRLRIWRTFGKGWSRRVNDVRKHALHMSQKNKNTTVPSVPRPPAGQPQPKLSIWELLIELLMRILK